MISSTTAALLRKAVPGLTLMGLGAAAIFRAQGVAVENRFPVPHTAYAQYWTGYPLPVTYLRTEPRAFQLGVVDARMIARRALYWLLLLFHGVVLFGIPIHWLRRRILLAD